MKIRPLLCVLASCIAVSTSTLAKEPASAMFRGNPSRTGVYDAVGVPQLTGVKWNFRTNGYVISSPALANGIAYMSSMDGNLYAID
jgi:hypothetical protein